MERVRVIHVTGDAGYAAALAARDALPAELRDRYRPYPFLHDDMTAALAAADLVVGRAGSSTLAEAAAFGLPIVVVPYPHAAGHQRLNAAAFADAGAAIADRGRGVRRGRAARGGRDPRRPGPPRRDVRRRPGARRARMPPARSRSWSLAVAEPGAAAHGGRDRAPIARGSPTVTGAPAFDAIAIGAEIQRRIGVKTVRDEPLARFTTMRVGGPADLFAVAHNAFELRGLVRFARARAIPFTVLGRGSNLVIATPGSAAS